MEYSNDLDGLVFVLGLEDIDVGLLSIFPLCFAAKITCFRAALTSQPTAVVANGRQEHQQLASIFFPVAAPQVSSVHKMTGWLPRPHLLLSEKAIS